MLSISNCCEGYNSKIKDLFKTKPHIYKLIIKLKDEEENIFKRYTQGEMLLLKKNLIILYLIILWK